jgi:hypothetical protein
MQGIARAALAKPKKTKRRPMLDYPPDYPGGFDGPTGAE